MLVRLVLIAAGYFLAVAAATVVTVAFLLAPAAWSGGTLAAFRSALADAPAIVVIGFFWTFICALPGFVVAVVLGERSRWRGWTIYAVAGLLDVIPSFAIFGGLTGSLSGMTELVLCAFPGGFAGGAAYWVGAGRFIAKRRSPA